jgi:hypothetical protein
MMIAWLRFAMAALLLLSAVVAGCGPPAIQKKDARSKSIDPGVNTGRSIVSLT